MKNISLWASKNVLMARLLIVMIEIAKGLSAGLIGYYFIPKLSERTLNLSVLLLVLLVSFLQMNHEFIERLNKRIYHKIRHQVTFVIFLCTFGLTLLLGNYYKSVGENIVGQWVHAGVSVRTDSTSQYEEKVWEKSIKARVGALSENKSSQDEQPSHNGRRVVYVLLFLLSLGLTYVATILSCSIACSGYGFLAVLSLLLTVGIFSGGIYFLMKAFRKRIKISKEMSREEKRKERKRFFITWGIVVSIISLLVILGNLS